MGYFLTQLDPNARVKGTRDPLGIQSVWTRFARRTVGGITSQTTSVNDFRILVMGSWLVDQDTENRFPDSSTFVCWEQLAAYSRYLADDDGFRGVTRTRYRLAQKDQPIRISTSAQILANQAGYGIWGLYRSTAWSTGLLSMTKPYVTHPDVEHVVNVVYRPRLEAAWGKDLKDLVRLVRHGGEIRPGTAADRVRMDAVARVMVGKLVPEERDLYRRFLLDGGPDGSGTNAIEVRRRQRILYRQLLERNPDGRIQPDDIEIIAAKSTDTGLTSALEDMLACGAVLDAASRVFSYISQCEKSTLAEEVEHLDERFVAVPHLLSPERLRRLQHLAHINPRLLRAPGDHADLPGRWLQIAVALHDKDLGTVIRLVLQQNLVVSQAKGGGAGWVTIGDTGRIKVSQPDHGRALDGWDLMDDPWLEPYYFANLLGLARNIEVA